MGHTRPKPDYAAGLLLKAFTGEEIQKLNNYTTAISPVYFTPELCFPFLVCEAKAGERGFDKADCQNVHSGAIAVNAIISLYKAAFGANDPDRVKSLSGQVLAFSVSHDNDRVDLYGHFAALTDSVADVDKSYRSRIDLKSLAACDGKDRYASYNFVRNVYDEFVLKHRQRIKDVVAAIPEPGQQTASSFTGSEIALDTVDSQANS